MTTHKKNILLHGHAVDCDICEAVVSVDQQIVHRGPFVDNNVLCTFDVNWTFTGYKKITITVTKGNLYLSNIDTTVIRHSGLANIVKPASSIPDPKTQVYIDGILSSPTVQERERYNAPGEWCYTVPQGSTIEFKLAISC